VKSQTATSPVPLDAAASGYPIRGIVGEVVVANGNTSETARQVLPWLAAVKDAYRAHRVPLWNRHSLSGTPLLGNGQLPGATHLGPDRPRRSLGRRSSRSDVAQ